MAQHHPEMLPFGKVDQDKSRAQLPMVSRCCLNLLLRMILVLVLMLAQILVLLAFYMAVL